MTHPFLRALGFSGLFLLTAWGCSDQPTSQERSFEVPLFSNTPLSQGDPENAQARAEWENMRLADPATGVIPAGIRQRELAFANQLPVNRKSKRNSSLFTQLGPFNVGGRTRGAAIDISDEQVILAGCVSGGLWKSDDFGDSWRQVSDPKELQSVTCIVQDTRAGETDTWYYGSGEGVGNSASASFSAPYGGNGIYKSTDGGETWTVLPATSTGTPHEGDDWDIMWRLAIDASNTAEDEIYAAIRENIMRSTDGGQTWTAVLTSAGVPGSLFSDVAVTSSGVVYAAFSSGGDNGGIWRSDDGINWTALDMPLSPTSETINRIVLEVDPNDENRVYFVAATPGNGKQTAVFFGGTEFNSLWKYTYQSGDGSGSGGLWEDLSANIPDGLGDFGNFNAQGSYNLMIRVKPNDPNVIFLGGTNLYRSTDGFTSNNNTDWVGGYMPFTTLPYFELYPDHHPDQHDVLFLPSDPDVVVSANDGGMYRSNDNTAQPMSWTNINNGYVTTQFYTVGIDHGTPGSAEVAGGLQDNGTWRTTSDDPSALWTFPSTGDGAHLAISDGSQFHYFSRQRGQMLKMELGTDGLPTAFTRIDPIGGSGYLFINPYILDPTDNDVMYLAAGQSIWRNDALGSIPLNNQYDTISTGWMELTNGSVPGNQRITALAASINPTHRLYYGTNSRGIYRVDDAHTGDPVHQNISTGITSGGYTTCIAVDPRDADKLIVVFSNYQVYSIYYSEDGGSSWEGISGNLEAEQPPNAPPGLGIGDGPSTRWASIIPVEDGTVFLVGTSVGLFATDSLMGDSTEWVAQAPNSIGRAVVDMIDYRVSDGFTAIATHGNGIFTANITSTSDIIPTDFPTGEGVASTSNQSLSVYPNPAVDHVTFKIPEDLSGQQLSLVFYDLNGRKISPRMRKQTPAGEAQWTIDVSGLPTGLYVYELQSQTETRTGKFAVK